MPRQTEMETDIEGCFWLKGNLSIEDTPIEEEEEEENFFIQYRI